MEKKRTIAEIHSAAKTQMGYFYQLLCFVKEFVRLESGDELHYEQKDDIDLSSATSGKQILIQVKHTVQKNNDKYISIKDNSQELWHTLGTWAEFLKEQDDNYKVINNYEFLLITNKKNELALLQPLTDFQNGKISFDEILNYINNVQLGETNNRERNKFNKISVDLQQQLLKNLSIITKQNDIEQQIETCIYDHYAFKRNDICDQEKAVHLKDTIISTIFRDLYHTNCNRTFTIDDKTEIANPILYPNKKLPIRKPNNNDLLRVDDKSIFIRQLIDIGELNIKDNDYEEIKMGIIADKLTAENYYDDLLKYHFKNYDEIESYKNSKKKQWRNSFNNFNFDLIHNCDEDVSPTESMIIKCATQVLHEIRNIYDEYGQAINDGTFYSLSDIPEIGWRYDWKTKYKNVSSNG
ncbi:MAG: hypothetical protein PUC50_16145 [Bacteroidales bacterium]|nr:hypothetical protein [Bacteroidales bacterium]